MNWLEKKIRMVSENLALCGGCLILASAFLVTVEVFLRKLANFSMGGADELSGYALGIGSSWAFALTLLARGNIRVDALYMMLSDKLAAVLDVVALIVLGAVLSVSSVFVWDVLFETIEFGSRANTPLATPLWIPQGLWFTGFVLFLIVFAYQVFVSVLALLKGDFKSVQKLLGARTVNDDIQDELGAQGSNLAKEG